MSGNSPSKIRRKGREAFEPYCDPMNIQPYKQDAWNYTYDLPHWLEGWWEAEKEWKQEQKEIDIQESCPHQVRCIHCGKVIDIKGE